MNDEYAQDFEAEVQDPSLQPDLSFNKSIISPNKPLKEKTSSNILIFFNKFNGLFNRIYSSFAKTPPTPILKEILYEFYEKLFIYQTKFVMMKGNNDFFLNPLNKSLLNEAFEIYQQKSIEFNEESPETTLKIFLRSILSEPSNEIYLLRMREFLTLIRETHNNLKKKKNLDNERMKEIALKKYSKMLKRKEGKKDDELLKLIVTFFEGKDEMNNLKNEQKNEENNEFLAGRKINVEEKRMQNLRVVFLHYCKDPSIPSNNLAKRHENMNIGGFLAFLRDFKISNEYMSKPKTLEIFRKTAGNLQESDFSSFVKILKKLSEFFYFNELEKNSEAKFIDLLIYMDLDDRIKIKEKLSSITDTKPNDLVAKQQKLKEINLNANLENENQKQDSDDEEELKLQPIENMKTPKKTTFRPNSETPSKNSTNINEAHKKLNPLNSAKYKNTTPIALSNNRSKTKSPFRSSKIHDISISNTTPKEINKNNAKNLMPLYYNNNPGDIMKKSEKNQLYEKIFQRAQQVDMEEKMKHEEWFNKLQNQEDLKGKNPSIVKSKT